MNERVAQMGATAAKAAGIPIDYEKGASGWVALGPAIFFVAIAAAIIAALIGITAAIKTMIDADNAAAIGAENAAAA
jgi:hypothetical protein